MTPAGQRLSNTRRKPLDRIGDPALRILAGLACAVAVATVVLVIWKIFDLSGHALSTFGLGFVGSNVWDPTHSRFGGAAYLYGTAVSSLAALLIAGPMAIAISLFLTELAPRPIRRPVATLVDLLAAIPSVVLGLWGIIVMSPFVEHALEPALRSAFGWIPLFSGPSSPFGLLPAILVLTIMTVPIVSAVTREVFDAVPGDLKEGALALGATRWEMIRMVVLPYCRSGIVGGITLGLGRALGEAIAVTMLIGDHAAIRASLFGPADTLASSLAAQYQGATPLQSSALAYLAAILLVLAVVVNAAARLIVNGSAPRPAAGRPAL